MIDFALIYDSFPNLFRGALVTLQIALIAAVIGMPLGTVFAFLEGSKSRLIRFIVLVYVTIFRGTPMLVQILFVYYVLPQFGVMIAPFWAASMALGLNSGAYVSQIMRSGINAVSVGQIEAAKTLGLSRFTTIKKIIFPQAVAISWPSLGNELITLVKDSSLASIIGVVELAKEASIIRSRTYDAFSVLLAASLIYLVLTGILSYCIKRSQKCFE